MFFWKDLTERSVATFIQAFAAAWVVTGDFDVTNLKIAVAAGVLAVAKGLAARHHGFPDSASFVD